MPEYRRAFVPGGTFFFTVVTANRQRILTTPRAIDFLKHATLQTQARWPFTIDASVILPDHLHAIWTLPKGDFDFSMRWGYLKKTFTKAWLAERLPTQRVSASQQRDRRAGVWQRRFWEHTIRDERDMNAHHDYIHFNPVKHGLATCPHAWPHSTFEKAVRETRYDADWCCSCGDRRAKAPTFDEIAAFAME